VTSPTATGPRTDAYDTPPGAACGQTAPSTKLGDPYPEHTAAPGTATIDGTMQTPDGHWRVDIMRRGDSRWYRIHHQDNEFDWLDVSDVERLLTDAGVDLSHLEPTDPAPPHPGIPA
jgi:bifunctional non-homologous end joining protein LigD